MTPTTWRGSFTPGGLNPGKRLADPDPGHFAGRRDSRRRLWPVKHKQQQEHQDHQTHSDDQQTTHVFGDETMFLGPGQRNHPVHRTCTNTGAGASLRQYALDRGLNQQAVRVGRKRIARRGNRRHPDRASRFHRLNLGFGWTFRFSSRILDCFWSRTGFWRLHVKKCLPRPQRAGANCERGTFLRIRFPFLMGVRLVVRTPRLAAGREWPLNVQR